MLAEILGRLKGVFAGWNETDAKRARRDEIQRWYELETEQEEERQLAIRRWREQRKERGAPIGCGRSEPGD